MNSTFHTAGWEELLNNATAIIKEQKEIINDTGQQNAIIRNEIGKGHFRQCHSLYNFIFHFDCLLKLG